MKGAKLYKVEVWHYDDDFPELEWTNPPDSTTTVPDCESFEFDFAWDDVSQTGGFHPGNLLIYGTVKCYDHKAAFDLISLITTQDEMVIGDCLLLYYQTDDGERYRYRFNGVYFGSTRTMRTYFTEAVDTGELPHSLLTWVLARFHHNSSGWWNIYANRVLHQWWNGSTWVAAPLPGPAP